LWSIAGEIPRASVATQFAIAATIAAIVHRRSQMKCGIARISRKKTVRRFRRRSSVTTTRIGCGSITGIIAPRRERPVPLWRVDRDAAVAYALPSMTPPVRTWWAWRRERSGSVAC
jgi:hypothetical protein